jgi:hypothetical protein
MSTMTSHPHADDEPGHPGSEGLHHATDDHGDDDGHDDHAHGDEALGPIDVYAWGAGVVGLVIGAAIAACFAFATGAI